MRLMALEDYLTGLGNVGDVEYAFSRFPKLSFDEEQVDLTIIGACQAHRNGGSEEALRRKFRDVAAYLRGVYP